MDPNLPFQPPAPVEPVQPIVPAMPPMESVPVAPPPVPPPTKKNWVLILGIVLLLASVLALVGYFLYQNSQSRINISTPTPLALTSPSPVATINPTANWKIYTGKLYSFKYPEGYILEEQADGINVKLSDSIGVFLQIYALETLTYENFLKCTDSLVEECLFKFGSQSDYTTDISVDGRKSKSFYYNYTPRGGTKNTHHEVEVVDAPMTGINAVIGDINQNKSDAEARDKIFNQILSTFQFTDTLGTPSATPTATPL